MFFNTADCVEAVRPYPPPNTTVGVWGARGMGAPPPTAIRLLHHLPINRHRPLAAATFTTEAASLATTTTDLTTTTILAAAATKCTHRPSRALTVQSLYSESSAGPMLRYSPPRSSLMQFQAARGARNYVPQNIETRGEKNPTNQRPCQLHLFNGIVSCSQKV